MCRFFKLFLILLILNSCSIERDWHSIESVIINTNYLLNLEEYNFNQLKSDSSTIELDHTKFRDVMLNSEAGKGRHIYKGASYNAIILFSDSTELKLKLSAIYGICQEIDYKRHYTLRNDNNLNSNRWIEMKK